MVTKSSLLNDFEAFLSSIPLEKYRTELLPIKTVEQDLPRELNPLSDIYRVYWVEEGRVFPPYDEFFDRWWADHLEPLDRFISQYFGDVPMTLSAEAFGHAYIARLSQS